MELITLVVEREQFSWYQKITKLKTKNGKIKAIFTSNLRQPKHGQKTIIINCGRYQLDWTNVPSKSTYIKIKDRVKV